MIESGHSTLHLEIQSPIFNSLDVSIQLAALLVLQLSRLGHPIRRFVHLLKFRQLKDVGTVVTPGIRSQFVQQEMLFVTIAVRQDNLQNVACKNLNKVSVLQ